MFDQVQPAPPDAILGLNEAFQADSNPAKINLTVGQYKDAHGETPILKCVKQAERAILEEETSKGYLGIVGDAAYDRFVPHLLFGTGHEFVADGRVVTVQTPGGTGAVRIAADLIATTFPDRRVWLSEPTWPNHPHIFSAAGVPIDFYAYYNPGDFSLNFEAMLADIEKMPEGDFVLLHGCCHNPTGVDLQPTQWDIVGKTLRKKNLTPLVDFAYQGFGDGIQEDAVGVRTLCQHVDEALICSSFSKNFGLYCERVGALSVLGPSADATQAVISRVKKCVRANYSNPPAHGARIVAKVLDDAKLSAQWETELAEMRQRIRSLRQSFADTMQSLDSPVDFSFITAQRGMFSFTGLTTDQVQRLRDDHAVYIVGNGRINVAGMRDDQVVPACQAIISVIGS